MPGVIGTNGRECVGTAGGKIDSRKVATDLLFSIKVGIMLEDWNK